MLRNLVDRERLRRLEMVHELGANLACMRQADRADRKLRSEASTKIKQASAEQKKKRAAEEAQLREVLVANELQDDIGKQITVASMKELAKRKNLKLRTIDDKAVNRRADYLSCLLQWAQQGVEERKEGVTLTSTEKISDSIVSDYVDGEQDTAEGTVTGAVDVINNEGKIRE